MKKLLLVDDTREFASQVIELADDIVEAKGNEDKILDAVASFLDTALPFDLLIPGAVGQAVELADGPVVHEALETLADFLKKLFHADPEKKAARQAKRRKKQRRKA